MVSKLLVVHRSSARDSHSEKALPQWEGLFLNRKLIELADCLGIATQSSG